MGQNKSNDPTKFVGSSMEKYLQESERIARNHLMVWFIVSLILIMGGVTLFSLNLITENNRLFYMIILVPLGYCLFQYNLFYRQRRGVRNQIRAYHQIETGGTLKKSAEIYLQQFYEQNHDPPSKMDMIMELLRRRKKGE